VSWPQCLCKPCKLTFPSKVDSEADTPQNFLPHNGYASVAQYIAATQRVVGMGPILSTFLSVLGGALDGDLLNWSMGGNPSLTQGGVTGILGNGLTGSHNKYESDASPTRPDLYQAGNNYKTVTAQFQELIDYSPGGVVTLESLYETPMYELHETYTDYIHHHLGQSLGVIGLISRNKPTLTSSMGRSRVCWSNRRRILSSFGLWRTIVLRHRLVCCRTTLSSRGSAFRALMGTTMPFRAVSVFRRTGSVLLRLSRSDCNTDCTEVPPRHRIPL
jgi:hypothetical protein